MKNNYKEFKDLDLKTLFREKFPNTPEMLSVLSPGRINLIGEHTDYSGGYVLPAAVDKHIKFIMGVNNTNTVNVYSANFDQEFSFTLDSPLPDNIYHWAKLFVGAVQLTQLKTGIDIVFAGDIPVGAGMSSSAAISTGLIFGINRIMGVNMDKIQVAKLAQKIEHEYAGVNCGLMDQLACLHGKTNQAMLINCSNFDMVFVEMYLKGYAFVLIVSKVEHQLNETAYNERYIEYASTKSQLEKIYGKEFDFKTLNVGELELIRHLLTEIQFKRARHIVQENTRVIQFYKYIHSNPESAGKLLTQSHESLKNDYNVTVEETDLLVSELDRNENVLGARQMGGGFGGCVILFMKDENLEKTISPVLSEYERKFGLTPEVIKVKIGNGTRVHEYASFKPLI